MGAISFDDVYANAYVRESVETLVTITVHQYPMLAGYEEEIRQDLWIAINRRLPLFDSEKSSIDTFCRRVMNTALKDIRRGYFTSKSISARNTVELDADSRGGELVNDDVNRAMLAADVRAVVMSLPPVQRSICEMIMDGLSMRRVAKRHNISVALIYKKYLNPLRNRFVKAGLKK